MNDDLRCLLRGLDDEKRGLTNEIRGLEAEIRGLTNGLRGLEAKKRGLTIQIVD